MRFLFILILSCLTAFADSPWQYFPTTNEMIAAAIPAINANFNATLGGFTGTNDWGGGPFQYKNNSLRAIDMRDIFPSSSTGLWMRVFSPVGTNAPSTLTIGGNTWPSVDATYDLGISSKNWRNLNLSGSLKLGSATSGYFPYFSSTTLTTPSPIFTDTSNVGIGTTSTPFTLTLGNNNFVGWEYNSSAASRRWAVFNDDTVSGDWALATQSSKVGALSVYRIYVSPTGNVRIPISMHIGGTSDPGANNLTVDGITTTATLSDSGNATVGGNTTMSGGLSVTTLITNATLTASLPVRSGTDKTLVSGAISLTAASGETSGILPESKGGTHTDTYSVGDLLVGSSGNTLIKLPAGTTGYVLTRTATTNIWAAPSAGTSANPSASVGLSAVNGSASTFITSDSAPPLSQSIAPTWTGKHTFSLLSGSGGLSQIVTAPSDLYTNSITFSGIDESFQYNSSGAYQTGFRLVTHKNNVTDGNKESSTLFYVADTAGSGYIPKIILHTQGLIELPDTTASRYLKLNSTNGLTGDATESANTIFAGPTSGGAAVPSFRALSAGDISGIIGSVSPTANNNEIIGSSTNYLLTGTMARVDFGSGDPQVTITAGKWLVTAILSIGGQANTTGVVFKFYNSTDSTDIANSFRSTQSIAGQVDQGFAQNIINVSGTKTIQLYAQASPDLGGLLNPSLVSTNTTITAINLSN